MLQQKKLCHDSCLQPAEKRKTRTRRCAELHKKSKMIAMYMLIEVGSTAPQKELHRKEAKVCNRSDAQLCSQMQKLMAGDPEATPRDLHVMHKFKPGFCQQFDIPPVSRRPAQAKDSMFSNFESMDWGVRAGFLLNLQPSPSPLKIVDLLTCRPQPA